MTCSIVVVDAGKGFGNGLCLPAGPLRETVAKTGLARAIFILFPSAVRKDQAQFDTTAAARKNLPHVRAELAPLQRGWIWSDTRAASICRDRHPEKFFATCAISGPRLSSRSAGGSPAAESPPDGTA